ncbi:MAG: GGDEF domain-containing protein [Candidatus Krumholzibacteriales bacterium]
MQQGFIEGYRFFLTNLIPREFLSEKRRIGVDNALSTGRRADMVREAYLSMEELSETGVFLRRGLRETEDAAVLEYRRRDQNRGITLEMTLDEYKSIPHLKGDERSRDRLTDIITDIMSELSLNGRSMHIADKISNMLMITTRVNPDSEAYLVLDRDLTIDARSEEVHQDDFYSIISRRLYRRSLEENSACTTSDRGIIEESYFKPGEDVKSVTLIPLVAHFGRIGILEIHDRGSERVESGVIRDYSLIAQGLIRLMSNNYQLEKMVSVDRLTQVNNRNYYETHVPLEIERASRERKPLGFLVIDIDHFKEFNDRYGHDVGDIVLKEVARTIRNHLRKIDLFIRYGGEEFVAVLPGAGKEAALRTAERIREVIESTEVKGNRGERLNVTVSIGGSIFPVDAADQEELFRAADKSLMKAKRSGRNRIIFYQDEED